MNLNIGSWALCWMSPWLAYNEMNVCCMRSWLWLSCQGSAPKGSLAQVSERILWSLHTLREKSTLQSKDSWTLFPTPHTLDEILENKEEIKVCVSYFPGTRYHKKFKSDTSKLWLIKWNDKIKWPINKHCSFEDLLMTYIGQTFCLFKIKAALVCSYCPNSRCRFSSEQDSSCTHRAFTLVGRTQTANK